MVQKRSPFMSWRGIALRSFACCLQSFHSEWSGQSAIRHPCPCPSSDSVLVRRASWFLLLLLLLLCAWKVVTSEHASNRKLGFCTSRCSKGGVTGQIAPPKSKSVIFSIFIFSTFNSYLELLRRCGWSTRPWWSRVGDTSPCSQPSCRIEKRLECEFSSIDQKIRRDIMLVIMPSNTTRSLVYET